MLPSQLNKRKDAISFLIPGGFVLASLPALIIGLWSLGQNLAGADEVTFFQALQSGAMQAIPRLILALLVSVLWAALFAKWRDRQLDPGWLYCAWMFVLLMPAAVPLPLIGLGLSFGLVFGCHVFGGTGRYFANPAVLGAVFLAISYPQAMTGQWLPGSDEPSTWSLLAAQGTQVMIDSGLGWMDVAIGREVTAMGAPSALACLAGALLLAFLRLASWRILAGGLLGMLSVAAFFSSIPWYWQPVLGYFALALAFIATDPTTTPESRIGCWTLGLTFGAITVIIRMLNPDHPEGTLFALLLAFALAPLIDHLSRSSSEAPATV